MSKRSNTASGAGRSRGGATFARMMRPRSSKSIWRTNASTTQQESGNMRSLLDAIAKRTRRNPGIDGELE
jgi:hypothetical protein